MRSPATPAGAWIQRVGIVLDGSVSLLEPGAARPLGRAADPRDDEQTHDDGQDAQEAVHC